LRHISRHRFVCLDIANVVPPAMLRYRDDMDTIARRSRMRRTRAGKRIELTDRDLDMFRWLARYRYLPSTYIHAFVGGTSETRFKERLGDLFHEGYLGRPERQWEMANCRHRPVIHELGAGATRVLDDGGIVEEPRTWFSASPHRQFSHSLMVSEALASIELGVRAAPNLRFVPWSEILAKASPATRALATSMRLPSTIQAGGVIPDGLFGIEYATEEKKRYRFFALEADRGTMPIVRSKPDQTSYVGKLAVYHDILSNQTYKTHLGIPNLFVLTVTTSEARRAEIVRKVEACGARPLFFFKAVDEKELRQPVLQLLNQPWPRAGLLSVDISESN